MFDLLDPTPDMVCVDDILVSSERIRRFTGHGRHEPLDLNQHHLLVLEIVSRLSPSSDPILCGQAITHDAHEAYVGDMSRPLKLALRELGGKPSTYDVIEGRAAAAVAGFFHLPVELPDVLKVADTMAIAWEAMSLFGTCWDLDLPPGPGSLVPVAAFRARVLLDRAFATAAADGWSEAARFLGATSRSWHGKRGQVGL